ncbi:MAG: hypothetical protein COW85_08045 [Ignavibacteria bacterium CG22_combo_CG10-13_8_21_14_all_37_15]|nr:MAG: hypothetical protein COW85_08045 [Ignavibacteria bacterium CG22_combo_CG10-13_8_21_14_all_37_15]
MLNKIKFVRIAIPILLLSFILGGWGNVGHRIINGNTVNSFPQNFKQFSIWKDSLANHGSDADYRKSADPTEAPKHYIDFEDYNDFVTKGTVIQDYDSAVAKYGLYAITDAGSLPWTIMQCYDTLITAFKQREWHHVVLLSADLGHYIGDANMPLHLTKNYDGQYTSQKGIHSRYESTMISQYSSLIPIHQNEAVYLSNVQDYIFSMTYQNYPYVDSVLRADSIAYAASSKNYKSTVYTQTLWNLTKNFTGILFSRSAEVLASVMYTAWINAGSPPLSPTFVEEVKNSAFGFLLEQNYPNPFNPSTTIKYSVPKNINNQSLIINLKVYDALGREVATLVNEQKEPGFYKVEWNATNVASGIYFYRIQAGDYSQLRKMMVLK